MAGFDDGLLAQSLGTAAEECAVVLCECLSICPVEKSGRLIALADVQIEIAGVAVRINGVRVERVDGRGGTPVRLPIDRGGRPVVDLPDEVRGPLGDTVLAAGLEAGVLLERYRQPV